MHNRDGATVDGVGFWYGYTSCDFGRSGCNAADEAELKEAEV